MEEKERLEAIDQLAKLAMEGQLVDPIDWEGLNIVPTDAFKLMAANVLDQMETVEEDQRAVVAMATMTKLLVENFIFKIKLQSKK